MNLELRKTAHNFWGAEFYDANGVECSIQESSAVGDGNGYLWLGRNEPAKRMHMNRKQAAALIPLLQRFVETGELSPPVRDTVSPTEKQCDSDP